MLGWCSILGLIRFSLYLIIESPCRLMKIIHIGFISHETLISVPKIVFVSSPFRQCRVTLTRNIAAFLLVFFVFLVESVLLNRHKFYPRTHKPSQFAWQRLRTLLDKLLTALRFSSVILSSCSLQRPSNFAPILPSSPIPTPSRQIRFATPIAGKATAWARTYTYAVSWAAYLREKRKEIGSQWVTVGTCCRKELFSTILNRPAHLVINFHLPFIWLVLYIHYLSSRNIELVDCLARTKYIWANLIPCEVLQDCVLKSLRIICSLLAFIFNSY